MIGRKAIGYLLAAVAIAAAAFLAWDLFRGASEKDKQGKNPSWEGISVSNENGDDRRGNPSEGRVTDTVLVEVDSAIRRIVLPDGRIESAEPGAAIPEEWRTAVYDGLDPMLQRADTSFSWLPFRRDGTIFGYVVASDGYGVLSVYACDTVRRACERADVAGAGKGSEGDDPVLPEGAVSATGKKVALVFHHDTPYVETGIRWELAVLEMGKFAEASRMIDISAAIDRGAESDYDSVSSVAWSPDENRLAIATNRRVFIVDTRSGDMTAVFEVPISDGDEEPSWDNSTLVWSPGGRYIVFTGFSPASMTDEESGERQTDMLQYIDLEEGNAVRTLLQGKTVLLRTY